jgi:CRISPR system Cascade subunit CasD
MGVLLLRLEGPMQSWGIESKFTDRQTETAPSKSGVIGLICCALGRAREDKIEDLTPLDMMVRVDREGNVVYDYHTTLDVLRASSSGIKDCNTYSDLLKMRKNKTLPKTVDTVLSRRFYLADACFLVGVEGKNQKLLENIQHALKKPRWPLFLGRKSFLPSSPIFLAYYNKDTSLQEVMKTYPWQGRIQDKIPESVRLLIECEVTEGVSHFDVPTSFRPRKFRMRNVKTEFISTKSLHKEENADVSV